jgi:hypothetical protein
MLKSHVPGLVKALAIHFALTASLVYAADIQYERYTYDDQRCPQGEIKFVGHITREDLKRINAIVAAPRNPEECQGGYLTVLLDSDGGDVESAIAIGRRLRDLEMRAIVKNCKSACVFILAGAVKRVIILPQSVRIHRPYFTDLPQGSPATEIQKRRRAANEQLRRYLDEMNVPTSLLDEMNSTPPHEFRALTQSEIDRYLPATDPDFDEKQTMKWAKALKISMAEYRRRDAAAREECKNFKVTSDSFNCGWAIKLGVSRHRFIAAQSNVDSSSCDGKLPWPWLECHFGAVIRELNQSN